MDNKVELCYIPGMKKIPKVDDVFWQCVGPVVVARWAEVMARSKVYSWVKHGSWRGGKSCIGWRCINHKYYPVPNAFSICYYDQSTERLMSYLEESKWEAK